MGRNRGCDYNDPRYMLVVASDLLRGFCFPADGGKHETMVDAAQLLLSRAVDLLEEEDWETFREENPDITAGTDTAA